MFDPNEKNMKRRHIVFRSFGINQTLILILILLRYYLEIYFYQNKKTGEKMYTYIHIDLYVIIAILLTVRNFIDYHINDLCFVTKSRGIKPTYYKIYYREKNEPKWKSMFVSALKTNGVLKDLKYNTEYEVYVVAYHGVNSGPNSEILPFKTAKKRK